MEKFKASQLLAIIQVLAKVALEKESIEYNQVSTELAESYNVKISPDDLEYPFDIIDRQAYKLGLPIISSVVISKRRNRPGIGYFKFLKEIKNNSGKWEDEESIWTKELKEVKECKDWSLLFEYYQCLEKVEEKLADEIRETTDKEHKNENSDSSHQTHTNVEESPEIEEDQIELDPNGDDNEGYDEGEERLTTTNQTVRNQVAPKIAKDKFKKEHEGKLFCEVCGFDFAEFYGDIGEGYIEAHHINYLSITGPIKTSLEDLTLLCANCHRVLHRSRVSIEEMKNTVNENNNKLKDGEK